MQDLRLVLIILGFMAIVALVAHGLWSNKKNQVKPLKDKPLGKINPYVKDKQGFDLDGIGETRIVSKSVEPKARVIEPAKPTPMRVDKIEPQFSATKVTAQAPQETSVVTSTIDVLAATTNLPTTDTIMDDVSYDVVDEAQPTAVEVEVELDPVSHSEVVVSTNTATAQNDVVDEAVFVINIMAREGKNITGAELLQELSAFGFKFGEMNIFHRHVDAAGKGPVIFSLANMVKPGVFDIDMMEQFESPGVSLFMMFPCAGQASHNYSLMLSAAERIAECLDGLLMDGSRNPLTEDAIAQEKAFIRQLENKALAKKTH